MSIYLAVILSFLSALSAHFCYCQLQQNGYKIGKFCSTVIKSKEEIISLAGGAVSIVAEIVNTKLSLFCTPAILIGIGVFSLFCKHKLRLKITKRIIRLFAVSVVLAFPLAYYASYLLPTALPFIAALSSLLLLPVEKLIAKSYIKRAREKLSEIHPAVIAITGSYGKTSVKNILLELLSVKYAVQATPKSYNTPLGIATFINNQLLKETEYLILEFGCRKKGDIAELATNFSPHHAIVTAIGEVHLETFGSYENIYKEKTSLFSYVNAGGIKIAGKSVDVRALGDDILTVASPNAQIRVENVEVKDNGTNFTICGTGKPIECATPLLGGHHAENVTLAYVLAQKLLCEREKLVAKIARLSPVSHRQQIIKSGNLTIIDDSYNANIQGIKALADILPNFSGAKAVITQGIAEGGRKQREQNEMAGEILAKAVNYAVVSGKNRKALTQGLKQGGLTEEHIYCVNNLQKCAVLARELVGERGVIVFQNDIPD